MVRLVSPQNNFRSLHPRPGSCVSTLLIIHHVWLPSQLPWVVSGLGWVIPIFKVLRSGCSCFNEQRTALMLSQCAGLNFTNGTLCVVTCSAYVLASTLNFWCPGQCSVLLLLRLLTPPSQHPGTEEIKVVVKREMVSACAPVFIVSLDLQPPGTRSTIASGKIPPLLMLQSIPHRTGTLRSILWTGKHLVEPQTWLQGTTFTQSSPGLPRAKIGAKETTRKLSSLVLSVIIFPLYLFCLDKQTEPLKFCFVLFFSFWLLWSWGFLIIFSLAKNENLVGMIKTPFYSLSIFFPLRTLEKTYLQSWAYGSQP